MAIVTAAPDAAAFAIAAAIIVFAPSFVRRLLSAMYIGRIGYLVRIARTAFAFALLAFVFRYLTLGSLENDHFVLLARAQQVLGGDWPVRDFEDPGQPLFYLAT